jgi:hypothetical protein
MKNTKLILIITAFFVIALCAVFLFAGPELTVLRYAGSNISDKKDVASDFNNTLAPVIALGAAFLTFAAFYVQYQANKQQRKQFKKQADDVLKDRFENKFYTLLELHKQNLHEISIGGYGGKKVENRKAFVSMYKELRYCFFIVKQSYQELKLVNMLAEEYTDLDLLKIAYIFFYAGVGIHSNKVNESMFGNSFNLELIIKVREKMNDLHKKHKTYLRDNAVPILQLDGLDDSMLPKSYRPLGGHMCRLGYYYRHLFQTVKYVVNQSDSLIDETQKMEYLRTLRAQLSDHEQVMLYYNAVIGFGRAWIENNYFTTYKMIHNLPLALADFGIIPEIKFKNEIEEMKKEGIAMFEWSEEDE